MYDGDEKATTKDHDLCALYAIGQTLHKVWLYGLLDFVHLILNETFHYRV